jgi:transposase
VGGRDDVVVAKGYRLVDRDQQFLMPESMRDWLPASDPVWLVISAVAGLDTSRLHVGRRVGGAGRAGYDPDMLLALLIWAWAQGMRSSRVIERLCQRDVAFRIICGGDAPDHVTISRFRAEAAAVCEDLFAQVLRLCAGLGMGQLGMVAIDSVKIASDASLAANRTEEGLGKAAAQQAEIDMQRARELAAAAAAEHAATDAAEDDLYGPGRRGDELPEELIDPRSRAARIQQALDEMKAGSAAGADQEVAEQRRRDRAENQQQHRQAVLDKYRAQHERGRAVKTGKAPPKIRIELLEKNLVIHRARAQAKIDAFWARPFRGGHIPGPVEATSAVRRSQAALDRAIAQRDAEQQAAQQQAAQQQVEHAEDTKAGPTQGREPKRNITDPQSRMMPLRGGGWLQGYNCQAATSSDGLIIATSVGNNPSDATAFCTVMGKAAAAAALIDTHRPNAAEASTGIGIVLADAGYLSTANLTAPGPDRLIAVGKQRERAATDQLPATGPPPPDATPIEAMTHRLRTAEGHELYKQRSHIAETPFAHAKHNLGFRRFASRGIDRAAAEFNFHALVHNLFKAIGAGAIAPATG